MGWAVYGKFANTMQLLCRNRRKSNSHPYEIGTITRIPAVPSTCSPLSTASASLRIAIGAVASLLRKKFLRI